MTPGTIRCLAPAKINLTLRVLGRRPDGFHELDSVVAFAAMGDFVELRLGGAPQVETVGPFAAAIVGENLVQRTLDALAEVRPLLRLGTVGLDKRLPVGAGLGGGSADAAALLRLARDANPESAHAIDWRSIALALGSDVPVCFSSRACRMRGRGDVLEDAPELSPLACVLINPRVAVPVDKTRQVFKRLDAVALGDGVAPGPAQWPTSLDGWLRWLAGAGNDLEAAAAAVIPAVAEVLAVARATPGTRVVRMSGAGPTCFALTATEAEANAVAAAIIRQRPGWWVQATMLA